MHQRRYKRPKISQQLDARARRGIFDYKAVNASRKSRRELATAARTCPFNYFSIYRLVRGGRRAGFPAGQEKMTWWIGFAAFAIILIHFELFVCENNAIFAKMRREHVSRIRAFVLSRELYAAAREINLACSLCNCKAREIQNSSSKLLLYLQLLYYIIPRIKTSNLSSRASDSLSKTQTTKNGIYTQQKPTQRERSREIFAGGRRMKIRRTLSRGFLRVYASRPFITE